MFSAAASLRDAAPSSEEPRRESDGSRGVTGCGCGCGCGELGQAVNDAADVKVRTTVRREPRCMRRRRIYAAYCDHRRADRPRGRSNRSTEPASWSTEPASMAMAILLGDSSEAGVEGILPPPPSGRPGDGMMGGDGGWASVTRPSARLRASRAWCFGAACAGRASRTGSRLAAGRRCAARLARQGACRRGFARLALQGARRGA